ncbi:hypothetical protein J7E29_07290 [Streptomyces sp. ISL-90]|nr:hypothetical protein [Streptomyces sp. ISL-90]
MNAATSESLIPQSTLPEDAVSAVLGLVVVSAVYADGRAHIMGLPDSFFTPWHAFLYGGLALLVLWLAVMSLRASRRSGSPRIVVIPAGYGFATVGAALFAIGGVADMIWHVIFGVEFGIDALLSPSHLLLFVGGSLLLSGPFLAFRRGETAPLAARIPALLAVVGITGVAAFALTFLSAFVTEAPTIPLSHAPEGTEQHVVSEGLASAGLGSFILTSLVLVIPAISLLRTRAWFPGALTVLVTAIAGMASALTGFQTLGSSVVAAFVSAVVLDLVVVGFRQRASERAMELIVASALPLLVWTGQLIAIAARLGLDWSPAMSSGVVLMSALVSFAVVLTVGGRSFRTTSTQTDVTESAPAPPAR